MSVSAISSHRPPSTRTPRAPRVRRRHVEPTTPSVLTVSFDVTLGDNDSGQPAARLLDLLQELVDRGEGTVTLSADARTRPTSVEPAVAFPVRDGVTIDRDAIRILAASRMVLRGGRPVSLTRLEFDLLSFLAGHPRRVFTRLQLLNNVWGTTTRWPAPSTYTYVGCGPRWGRTFRSSPPSTGLATASPTRLG